MKDLLILLLHLLITIAKLLGPGGAKAVVAENLLMKEQLLTIKRFRRRAPNLSAQTLTTAHRIVLNFLRAETQHVDYRWQFNTADSYRPIYREVFGEHSGIFVEEKIRSVQVVVSRLPPREFLWIISSPAV